MLSTCLCTCTCVSMWYSLIEQTKWMNEWIMWCKQRLYLVTSLTRSRRVFGGKLLTDDTRISSAPVRRYGNNCVSSSLARWSSTVERTCCLLRYSMSFYAEIADVFARGRHATASYSHCWSVQFPSKTATRFTTNVCTGKVVLVERQNKINRAC